MRRGCPALLSAKVSANCQLELRSNRGGWQLGRYLHHAATTTPPSCTPLAGGTATSSFTVVSCTCIQISLAIRSEYAAPTCDNPMPSSKDLLSFCSTPAFYNLIMPYRLAAMVPEPNGSPQAPPRPGALALRTVDTPMQPRDWRPLARYFTLQLRVACTACLCRSSRPTTAHLQSSTKIL